MKKQRNSVLCNHSGFSGGIRLPVPGASSRAAQASIGALRRNSGIGGGPLNLAKESHSIEWISACRELTRSPPHLSVHLSSDEFGIKLTFVTQHSVCDFNELSGNRDNRPVVPSSFADRIEMTA